MAAILQKLRPWTTSNFVNYEMRYYLRQEGFKTLPNIPLQEVPAEMLSEMCDEFRAGVFRKAGISDPKEKGEFCERPTDTSSR